MAPLMPLFDYFLSLRRRRLFLFSPLMMPADVMPLPCCQRADASSLFLLLILSLFAFDAAPLSIAKRYMRFSLFFFATLMMPRFRHATTPPTSATPFRFIFRYRCYAARRALSAAPPALLSACHVATRACRVVYVIMLLRRCCQKEPVAM